MSAPAAAGPPRGTDYDQQAAFTGGGALCVIPSWIKKIQRFLGRSSSSQGPSMPLLQVVNQNYQAASPIPEPFESLTDDEKRFAAELMTRFEQAEAEYGELPRRDILLPMLLSKNGRYDEAIVFAERRYHQSPSWDSAVGAANAARRAGDWDRAADMFARGAEHDPTDVTCLLEVGDIRIEQERWAEALASYEKALAREAENGWALPSAFFCRHQLAIQGNWLASLHELANQEGCTCGMEDCLTEIFGGYGVSRSIERAQYLLGKLGDGT
jgi:tetratricopeptide (TPR) repeat protein